MGNQIFEPSISVQFLFRLTCSWLIEPMTTVRTVMSRECVSMGAVGAQTCRSLGHHLLHPQILTVQLPENQLVVLLKLNEVFWCILFSLGWPLSFF